MKNGLSSWGITKNGGDNKTSLDYLAAACYLSSQSIIGGALFLNKLASRGSFSGKIQHNLFEHITEAKEES